jgi:hypothetical protein
VDLNNSSACEYPVYPAPFLAGCPFVMPFCQKSIDFKCAKFDLFYQYHSLLINIAM